MRAEVGELLLRLERENPTAEPARSLLLNGVWDLRYTGGLAAGMVDSPTRELALGIYSAPFSAGVLKQLLPKLPFGSELQGVSVAIQSAEAGQPRVTTTATAAVFGATQVGHRPHVRRG